MYQGGGIPTTANLIQTEEHGTVMHGNILEAKAAPITCELRELEPINIILVNGTPFEPTWDRLVRRYHYLGYSKMYGPRVKYLAMYQDKPLAAISFNRATLKVGVRDRFIGWDDTLKRQHLDQVVCNNRLLILPWVRVRNLASYLLSRTLRLLKEDWLRLYGTSVFLVETFVDRSLYLGTCYKGAGWQQLGETQGFAKAGEAYIYHGNRKTVFVKVLDKQFRKQLGVEPDSRPLHPRRAEKGRGTRVILSKPDYDPEILAACGIKAADVSAVSEMLEQYLETYRPCYHRLEQKHLVDTFIKGLLSDLERKSIEPVALRYSGVKGVRPLQMFFKNSPFAEAKMLKYTSSSWRRSSETKAGC